MTIDKLLHLRIVVDELYKAVERGDDVTDRVNVLYRAATGRADDTDARRNLMVAIGMTANHTDEEYEQLLGIDVTDEVLCDFVCGYLEGETRDRLRQHPVEVSQAVRSWRAKGRPKRGERRVGKWEAVAALIQIARLGSATFTAENAEQIWKEHGLIWERDGSSFIPTERPWPASYVVVRESAR